MNSSSKESFGDIIKGEMPVLVDFYAEWCGPCKMMKPILKELKKQAGSTVRIMKIDVDKNQKLAASLNISGVPTLVLYNKGQVVWRQTGVLQAKQLLSIIQQKTG